MERMEETDLESNNSLLLIAEACRRGHESWHFHPGSADDRKGILQG